MEGMKSQITLSQLVPLFARPCLTIDGCSGLCVIIIALPSLQGIPISFGMLSEHSTTQVSP